MEKNMSLIHKEMQKSTSDNSEKIAPNELPDWFDPLEAEAAAEEICKKHDIYFEGGFFAFWFVNAQKPQQGLAHGMLMLRDRTLRHVRTIAEAVRIGRMFGLPGVYEYPVENMADEGFSWMYINKKKKEG